MARNEAGLALKVANVSQAEEKAEDPQRSVLQYLDYQSNLPQSLTPVRSRTSSGLGLDILGAGSHLFRGLTPELCQREAASNELLGGVALTLTMM